MLLKSLSAALFLLFAATCARAQSPALSAAKPDPLAFHEDWTSLSTKGSDLLAVQPVLVERNDVPKDTFIRERYTVQWRPLDSFDLYVILPKGVAHPPVALYLYSFPQDTDRFKDDGWCTRVTSGKYAAVGFVSALTGHRWHDRPMKEWFISELQESLASSVHDVQMILNYLSSRGDLDMSRVAMFGQGSGGSIAILSAAADPRIRILDLLDPWGDWPDWLAKSPLVPDAERASYQKPGFLAKVAPLDPLRWLPKLKTQRIRIQNVRDEANNPVPCQEQMEKAIPPDAELYKFDDGVSFAPAAGGGKLFDWIKRQLDQPLSQASTLASGGQNASVHKDESNN